MAQALFRIGWPGGGDAEESDFIRSILLEDRLRQHDREGAAAIAAGFSTPSQILPLVVQRRFDAVLPPDRNRLELLRDALATRDRVTAEARAAAPQDAQRVLDRAQCLRGLGRDTEALALLVPFTRDVRATVAAGRWGMWLINEASSILLGLGREDQAISLMRRLLDLPIAENQALIGPFINHAEMLAYAGRYAESLDYARTLQRRDGHYANAYGKMGISAAIVCALARLNRAAEAAPELAQMHTQSETNPAALTRAYLCVGDDDAAAALMVHRLQSDDPQSAILALENYATNQGGGRDAPLVARLVALRDRPEVRDAFGRVAHLLTLPLEGSYWGGF
jgi:thioredoxin-like negative regulator of GroEL